MTRHPLHHQRAHQSVGVIVVIMISAAILLYFLVRSSDSIDTTVKQVPSDIKSIKAIKQDIQSQGVDVQNY